MSRMLKLTIVAKRWIKPRTTPYHAQTCRAMGSEKELLLCANYVERFMPPPYGPRTERLGQHLRSIETDSSQHLATLFSGNRLEVLPPSLSQLTQLEVLTLSSNHVYQLPDEIVGLTKLKVGVK